jgi:hypothetical protein
MLQQDMEGYTALAQNPRAGDDKLYVVFSQVATENQQETAKAGRPIFEDLDWIEIRAPGDRDVIKRPADEGDRRRFARQYAAYKQGRGENEQIVGTPLAAVPWVTRSQVEEFAFFKVRTVEQLVGMSDALGQRFPGFQGLKQRAQVFLEAAAGAAPGEKHAAELKERDERIAALEAQMRELVAAQARAAEAQKPVVVEAPQKRR